MKSFVVLALIGASILTSACGSDSKKKTSQPTQTFYHSLEGNQGMCIEIIKEQFEAKGYTVTDEATPGACPASLTVDGEQVKRYSACPTVSDEGLPYTVVFYSKFVNDEGETVDLSILSPQQICAFAK